MKHGKIQGVHCKDLTICNETKNYLITANDEIKNYLITLSLLSDCYNQESYSHDHFVS